MTPAEEAQLRHTFALALCLVDRGVQCAIHFPLAEAPLVRVAGFAAIETTALADGHYEIWDVGLGANGDPSNPAPLRCYQSLAEAVTFLSAGEGTA